MLDHSQDCFFRNASIYSDGVKIRSKKNIFTTKSAELRKKLKTGSL